MRIPQASVQSAETWEPAAHIVELGRDAGFGVQRKCRALELEKIRQTTTWGIKMLESNFYSGLVTEAAVVTAVQFSAQNAGCGSSGQPQVTGVLCQPHGALPARCRWREGLEGRGGKRARQAPTAAAFRTRVQSALRGTRSLPSPAECGILGLREPGRPTRGRGAELPHPSAPLK